MLLLLLIIICIVHIDVVSVIVAVVRLKMLISRDTFSILASFSMFFSVFFVVILVVLQPTQAELSWAELRVTWLTQCKNPIWLTHLAFFDSDNNESLKRRHNQLHHVMLQTMHTQHIHISTHKSYRNPSDEQTCMHALRRVSLHSLNNCNKCVYKRKSSSNPMYKSDLF